MSSIKNDEILQISKLSLVDQDSQKKSNQREDYLGRIKKDLFHFLN